MLCGDFVLALIELELHLITFHLFNIIPHSCEFHLLFAHGHRPSENPMNSICSLSISEPDYNKIKIEISC